MPADGHSDWLKQQMVLSYLRESALGENTADGVSINRSTTIVT